MSEQSEVPDVGTVDETEPIVLEEVDPTEASEPPESWAADAHQDALLDDRDVEVGPNEEQS